MKAKFALLILLASVALCGCGDSEKAAASTAEERTKAISDANKEEAAKNPPPPGEGPSN